MSINFFIQHDFNAVSLKKYNFVLFCNYGLDLPISSHKQSSYIVIVTKVNRHYRHHHDRHIKILKKYLNALLLINLAKKLFANHFIIPYYTGPVQNMLKKMPKFSFFKTYPHEKPHYFLFQKLSIVTTTIVTYRHRRKSFVTM